MLVQGGLVRAKLKAKKETKGKFPERGLPWFVWLAIGLGIVAVVAFVRTSPTCGPTGSTYPGELKAAILDQLYVLQPNRILSSIRPKALAKIVPSFYSFGGNVR